VSQSGGQTDLVRLLVGDLASVEFTDLEARETTVVSIGELVGAWGKLDVLDPWVAIFSPVLWDNGSLWLCLLVLLDKVLGSGRGVLVKSLQRVGIIDSDFSVSVSSGDVFAVMRPVDGSNIMVKLWSSSELL